MINEEELKKIMQNGFDAIKPKIEEMTNAMVDCYQLGFSDCWKLFTGKEL